MPNATSLDLYVHCKSSKRITTQQLAEAMAARHMGAAVFDDYIDYRPASDGPLESCTILGWMPERFDSSRLTKLLEASDKAQLNRLFADATIAYANVHSYDSADHYATFGDGYLDSLAGAVDQQFLDFIKSSTTAYEIQTSSGRSEFSWRFQTAVCCAIAVTTDGLIEEPQTGDYFFPDRAGDYFRQLTE